MAVYYNEFDKNAAAWLRELMLSDLIPRGDVDERSIEDVTPQDLHGYTQCHFFAGIGGWAYALSLAGWADDAPVWTGSCPCQCHSRAAHGRNVAADLWPEFRRLIVQCRPPVVFGEQVRAARCWLDGVCSDMEAVGYAFRACVLPAYSVGLDHARERIYFEAHSDSYGKPGKSVNGEVALLPRSGSISGGIQETHGFPGRMALMRGYGNAIVPEVAAAFVETCWR